MVDTNTKRIRQLEIEFEERKQRQEIRRQKEKENRKKLREEELLPIFQNEKQKTKNFSNYNSMHSL